ncbi:hypothetical protein [Microcoleus sp. CAWBG58]|uniref:hypothetical protein n=1 Tax=Microcoleus sp. CAWBG58 TaxID=2841651 RepID=UPI0025FFF1DE|nr:hypothetical protein [Microcoleus sp. CAWBG58]
MTQINPDRTTGTIAIDVGAQSNGQYLCQISSSLSDRPHDTMNFYGQTKEHAIAIASASRIKITRTIDFN